MKKDRWLCETCKIFYLTNETNCPICDSKLIAGRLDDRQLFEKKE